MIQLHVGNCACCSGKICERCAGCHNLVCDDHAGVCRRILYASDRVERHWSGRHRRTYKGAQRRLRRAG